MLFFVITDLWSTHYGSWVLIVLHLRLLMILIIWSLCWPLYLPIKKTVLLKYRYWKASRAGDADIGPVITLLNPNAVKPRQYALMRLLANWCPKSMITHTNMLSEKKVLDEGVGFDKSIYLPRRGEMSRRLLSRRRAASSKPQSHWWYTVSRLQSLKLLTCAYSSALSHMKQSHVKAYVWT